MGRGLRGRWRWEVPSAGVALFVSRVAAFETRKLPTGLDRDGGGGRAARVTAAAEFPGKRWLLIPVVGGRTQVPARRVGGGAAGRCPPRRRGGVWGSTERWPTSSVTAPRVEQERGVATTRRACKRGRAPGCSRKPHASVARVPRARPGPGKHVPHSPFTQYRRRWLVRQRPMTLWTRKQQAVKTASEQPSTCPKRAGAQQIIQQGGGQYHHSDSCATH